jgi:hypothetical protein
LQTTKSIVCTNIAALVDEAIKIYRNEYEICILISPESTRKAVELLEIKYGLTHYFECVDILQYDIDDAIKNGVPMMIGLLSNGEIVTERLRKELKPDAFMQGIYFVEDKYSSCLTIINPCDYRIYEMKM